ncbi:larval cuticle protein LCP-14-like [Ostrinia nubilalis]|uniref:larval cuticle protein LCP-14-like n=1 Tax=Ostrinia furnacalis TaxID=93504 RepID=UPI00103B30E9|nr:larval cuticle protein LCP-14-like [Ostrinia furnacalis]
MKFFIVASCLVACAFAASVEDQNAETLRSSSDSSPDGSFSYTFETSNGISGQAEGHVKPSVGKDEPAIEVSGSSQYISPEGEKISLTYVANENGYQPQGDHLPTPPPAEPIPEYIQKALKYIEEHPYVEKNQ